MKKPFKIEYRARVDLLNWGWCTWANYKTEARRAQALKILCEKTGTVFEYRAKV